MPGCISWNYQRRANVVHCASVAKTNKLTTFPWFAFILLVCLRVLWLDKKNKLDRRWSVLFYSCSAEQISNFKHWLDIIWAAWSIRVTAIPHHFINLGVTVPAYCIVSLWCTDLCRRGSRDVQFEYARCSFKCQLKFEHVSVCVYLLCVFLEGTKVL